ncbi:MAG: peptidase M61, partial [Sandarakinorhabdus sp.]|nr:peptidase M61 [Sandarakinorhabdus sp.]
MRKSLLLLGLLATSASAVELSKPTPPPVINTIPIAQDTPFPGTLTLKVDATDTVRGIFHVTETIPVPAAGPMTLLFPKWLPGNHGPSGQISKLASLVITAGGMDLVWPRDEVDVFAIHIDVPAGARTLDVRFDFLTP